MLQYLSSDWQLERPEMPFGWIGATASAVAARGVDIEAQLMSLGIGAGGRQLDAGTMLSPTEYMLMCVSVINTVDDEMHGTTRARMRRGTAALGLKLFGTGRTLGTAIGSLFRFYEIAGGFCAVGLSRDDNTATIEIHADGERSDLTAVVEEMMATHLHLIFSYYLGFFLPLAGFTTTSVRHPNLGRRHAYLGAHTSAGDVTRMIFPASYLELPARRQLDDKEPLDAVLYWLSCFEPRDAPGALSETIGETGRIVFSSLLSEDLSFDQCCAEMGVGARALRDTLFSEGATYRQLRKFALIERVRPFLEAQASTDDMAFGLGYSDARSLRRALKSATGYSLGEMRRPGPETGILRGPGLVQNLRTEMSQMS